MKNIFLSFLLLLFTTALFAQQKDTTIVKPHCKLKTEFSLSAILIKENVNKYWGEFELWAPDWVSGYRDYSTPLGNEFSVNLNLYYKRIFTSVGVGYRQTSSVNFIDSFVFNKVTGAKTNNLKESWKFQKGLLEIAVGCILFERVKKQATIYCAFKKNIISIDSYKAINKDYYEFIKYNPGSLQDFESIGILLTKKLKYLNVSIPIEIETSYYKDYHRSWFFYYKTGLIVSF